MNERDLKLICKQIKIFYSFIQWQIVEIGQCYTVACACNLQDIPIKYMFAKRGVY